MDGLPDARKEWRVIRERERKREKEKERERERIDGDGAKVKRQSVRSSLRLSAGRRSTSRRQHYPHTSTPQPVRGGAHAVDGRHEGKRDMELLRVCTTPPAHMVFSLLR